MKIALVLSIREKSTRLPHKVLMKLSGQTVTEHLIDRMKLVKNADMIIVGTSDDPRDFIFKEIAEKKNINYFFGDQEDKLLRYYQICKHFHLDGIVVVDGDDILCFPEIMEENIKLIKKSNFDVIFWKNLPLGAASSALTKDALEKVISIKDESDTEVWGEYFIKSNLFKVGIKEPTIEILRHPEVRMTLDYIEDFEFLTEIFNNIYNNKKMFSSIDLMDYIINKNPKIIEHTLEAQKKYEVHIKKSKPIKLKLPSKFLIIGLGSMGKRRIRCLKKLGYDNIIGYDSRVDRMIEAKEKYKIEIIEAITNITFSSIDAVIVSTPPDYHTEYAKLAIDNSKPVFIEGSVILDEVIKIQEYNLADVFIAPSCTLMFHPIIKEITKIVNSSNYGNVTNFIYHSGQYLRDWHPWEDITEFYVSKRETGGGREIVPFELTWIVNTFGLPKDVKGLFKKTIDLNVDIEDCYAFLLDYNNKIGCITVDVNSRFAVRNLTINFEFGQIQWKWDESYFKLYEANSKRWIVYNQPEFISAEGYNKNIGEEMYIDELQSFISGVYDRNSYPNSINKDIKILELLSKIENSDGGF